MQDLQIKIYKSTKAGKKSLVKTHIKYLVKSKQACFLAVRKVVTNSGGQTPGVDNYVPTTVKEYEFLINKLINCKPDKYKARPLKRIWIPKASPSKDLRPISIPTIFDRCVQAVWVLAIDPINEVYSDKHNYGFRKGRSPIDAQEYLQTQLARPGASEYILEVDIKKCFDTISHQYILENIPVNKKILKQWLKCGVIEPQSSYTEEEGVPQGGIISPIICNLVLNGFEEHIKKHIKIMAKKYPPLESPARYFLFCRFADDMVIIARSKHILTICRQQLDIFLSLRGLKINEKKTRITHIEEGFKFVGFFIKRYKKTPKQVTVGFGKYAKKHEYTNYGPVFSFPPRESLSKIMKNINKMKRVSKNLPDL